MVVGGDGGRSILELDGEDIISVNVANGPTDIEVVDVRREDIDVGLHFVERLPTGFVDNFQLEHVPALIRWIVDAVAVLILGCDVQLVCG